MGKRKPLKHQKGNLTQAQKQQKELEEEKAKNFVGKNHLQNPPEWLVNDVAVAEWKRVVKELEMTPLFNNLDYNNLGVYCNAVAKYQEIVKKIGSKFRVGKEINNLTTLELKYSDEIKKYGSLLGLTLDGKLKLITGEIKSEGNKVDDIFGEI